MTATEALLLVTRLISAMDAALALAGNSQKFRSMVASAIAEGRDLTDVELAQLRADAQASIDKLEG